MAESRKNCTHESRTEEVIVVSWCVRCSGWRYARVSYFSGLGSASSSEALSSERHFLPAETTDPTELSYLIQRAFRAAQEGEQDARNN
jgi:hypothetical protein